jgi:excisionase family DNA binding protein
MSELPELWNIDRLAEYLGASKSFVYRLTREHRIGFLKVGKELRFRPEDGAAYLEPSRSRRLRRPTRQSTPGGPDVVGRATGTGWPCEPPS